MITVIFALISIIAIILLVILGLVVDIYQKCDTEEQFEKELRKLFPKLSRKK